MCNKNLMTSNLLTFLAGNDIGTNKIIGVLVLAGLNPRPSAHKTRDGTMLGPRGAMAPPGPMRKREIYNI